MSTAQHTAAPAESLSEALAARATTLTRKLSDRFDLIARERFATERRWLDDLAQYRRKYTAEQLKTMDDIPAARSRIFIGMTEIKVRAVTARMLSMLFPANSEQNWSISPTPIPASGPAMAAAASRIVQQQLAEQLQAAGIDPRLADPLQVGQAVSQINTPEAFAALREQLMQVAELRSQIQIPREQLPALASEVAQKAAEKMAEKMKDQLAEVQYKSISKQVMLAGNLYGTGVLKAPMIDEVEESHWQPDSSGRWELAVQRVLRPSFQAVSHWDFYPDENADNLESCEIFFQYHALNKSQLLALADSELFDGALIRQYVAERKDGDTSARWFEVDRAAGNADGEGSGRAVRGRQHYRLLECWLPTTSDEAVELLGADGDEQKAAELRELLRSRGWINVWLLGELPVRVSTSAVVGMAHPYHVYHYDKQEGSFWAEGLATKMRELQTGLNAAARMCLDNGAATLGGVYEIDESAIAPSDRNKSPVAGQVFRRMSGSANQAIRVHQVDSRIAEILTLKSMFEQLIHELTIPAYMHADQNVGGAGRTASGLSMLMGAANVQITDQIGNWDEGIIKPAIRALYHWNMENDPDIDAKGDFSVVARGSTSLVAKEVRGNQLAALMQTTANPLDAPFMNRKKILAEVLKVQDLDGDEFLLSDDDERVMWQQQMTQMQQQLEQVNALLAEATRAAPGVMRDIALQMQQQAQQQAGAPA